MAVLFDRRENGFENPYENDDPVAYPKEKRDEDLAKADELREKMVEVVKNADEFSAVKRTNPITQSEYVDLLRRIKPDAEMRSNNAGEYDLEKEFKLEDVAWLAQALADRNGDRKTVFVFADCGNSYIIARFDPEKKRRFIYMDQAKRFNGIFGKLDVNDRKHLTVLRRRNEEGWAPLKDDARKFFLEGLSGTDVSLDIANGGILNVCDHSAGRAWLDTKSLVEIIDLCYYNEACNIIKELIIPEWNGRGTGVLRYLLQEVAKSRDPKNWGLVLRFNGRTEVPQNFIDSVNAGLGNGVGRSR